MRLAVHAPRPRRGAAMLWALVTVFVATAACGVLLTTALASNREAGVVRHGSEARFLAEGALEAAEVELREAVANFQAVPADGAVAIDGHEVEYELEPTGFTDLVTDPSGIQTLLTGYRIDSRAFSETAWQEAHAFVNVEATPIFQFAVFYTNDLEILPGPSMTLGGRVHTNADMYLGCGNTLTIDTNYVHAVGDVHRNRKDDPSKSDGTVKIRQWVVDPYDPLEPAAYVNVDSKSQLAAQGVPSTSGYDSVFEGYDANGDGDYLDASDVLPFAPGALVKWGPPSGYTEGGGYTLLTADHGVGEAAVPSIGSIAMFEEVEADGDFVWDEVDEVFVQVAPGAGTHAKGYYHEQADLSLHLLSDGSFSAYDGGGSDVTYLLAGVVSVGELYDARQANGSGGLVQVLEVDVEALNASGLFPANGLIYAGAHAASTGTDCAGVLLKDGSELAGPLTVVTENSLYVKGDYNTTGKQGAAVIADAVNLLSNAWTGTKAPGQLPTASATSFNVAMISGNHDTAGSAYNGGLENLPRFHEKWTGIDCKIVGSFVNTWTSAHATGTWKYGSDRYTAPVRKWSYDTDFNDVAKLPPFTPMAVTTAGVAFWNRLQP